VCVWPLEKLIWRITVACGRVSTHTLLSINRKFRAGASFSDLMNLATQENSTDLWAQTVDELPCYLDRIEFIRTSNICHVLHPFAWQKDMLTEETYCVPWSRTSCTALDSNLGGHGLNFHWIIDWFFFLRISLQKELGYCLKVGHNTFFQILIYPLSMRIFYLT
jgi:hypothetical protein